MIKIEISYVGTDREMVTTTNPVHGQIITSVGALTKKFELRVVDESGRAIVLQPSKTANEKRPLVFAKQAATSHGAAYTRNIGIMKAQTNQDFVFTKSDQNNLGIFEIQGNTLVRHEVGVLVQHGWVFFFNQKTTHELYQTAEGEIFSPTLSWNEFMAALKERGVAGLPIADKFSASRSAPADLDTNTWTVKYWWAPGNYGIIIRTNAKGQEEAARVKWNSILPSTPGRLAELAEGEVVTVMTLRSTEDKGIKLDALGVAKTTASAEDKAL